MNNTNLLNDYKAKIILTEKLLWNLFPIVGRRGREYKNKNIKGFIYTYNTYANYFGIDNILEVSHFLAQIAHESDQFNAYEEYASGNAYDTRVDLGNTPEVDGDGAWFKGRSPMQTTGRANYDKAGDEIATLPFLNEKERKLFENDALLKNPKLLADPVWGTLAAFIYWVDKDLSSLCKPANQKVTITRKKNGKWGKYSYSPIDAISFKVNGGWNGITERRENYNKIFKALS